MSWRRNPSSELEDIAQIGGIALAPAIEAIEPVRVTVPQPAWEQPILFTDEMRKVFRSIRMSSGAKKN